MVPRSISGTPKRRQKMPKVASSATTRMSGPQRQLHAAGHRKALDRRDHGL